MPPSDDSYEKPVLVSQHLTKPMVLNPTNTKIIAALVGSADAMQWIGKSINVYHDRSVRDAHQQVVGGLRIQAVQQMQQPAPMAPIQYPPATPSGSGTSQQQGPEGTPPANFDPDVPF